MKRFRVVSLPIAIFIVITGLAALSPEAIAQSATDAKSSFSDAVSPTPGTISSQLEPTYTRPTEKTKLRNYFFDGFGPYAIISAGIVGGIDQADKTPPEWGQGAGSFGERVGSDFGIALATTTTRYASGRHIVLPLRLQRNISAIGPCRDFDGDGAARRERTSLVVFPRADRALCGIHDCSLWLVSEPL